MWSALVLGQHHELWSKKKTKAQQGKLFRLICTNLFISLETYLTVTRNLNDVLYKTSFIFINLFLGDSIDGYTFTVNIYVSRQNVKITCKKTCVVFKNT